MKKQYISKTNLWIVAALLFVISAITVMPAFSQAKATRAEDNGMMRKAEDARKSEEKAASAVTTEAPSGPSSLAPPSNDNFANAAAVPSNTFQTFTNVDATGETGEPSHGAGHGSIFANQKNSVWFKYTASANGVLTVMTSPTSATPLVDSVMSVYVGGAVNGLQTIAETDDYPNDLHGQVSFTVHAGITYYIAIDGYLTHMGNFMYGQFFNLTPPNDHHASGTFLGPSPRSPYIGITGSTYGATAQPNEPIHHDINSAPTQSSWHVWIAPTTGSYTFTTSGSSFDTMMAVYLAQGGGIGPLVGSSDDFGDSTHNSQVTFHATTGSGYLIAVDSYQSASGNYLLNWYPNRAESGKKFDFDGDQKSDISIFRPSNGQWWIKRSTGGHFAATFGVGTDEQTPADFTGDGKVDMAIWRPANGNWYVLRSEDFTYYAFPFGTAGDIPAVGHFDADDEADAVVFRPSNGTWHINRSGYGYISTSFGTAGDVPVIGDYDGDGVSDIAIFRPSNGQWWIARSKLGLVSATFGAPGDVPVPGAYTGEGRANLAFWRPSTGQWFMLNNIGSPAHYSMQFGLGTDIPAPGDYDGDGKTDQAVFRPSSGVWYVNRSNGVGTLIEAFGTNGDRPAASSFIP